MLAHSLRAAARSERARCVLTGTRAARRVVDRFVPGEALDDVLPAVAALVTSGLAVTVDYLGEDSADAVRTAATRDTYVRLLRRLADLGVGPRAEVSLKLSALGQALPRDGQRTALDNARAICAAAASAATTVTLDMEDHTTVDSTLAVLRELRVDHPSVGAVLQSCLRRTEQDCRDLAHAGSRVRLVKGAYAESASVAYTSRREVDLAYVRCLRILMAGAGYPMVATHDPRIIAVTRRLAADLDRPAESYEFQMLYGIRVDEQRRLRRAGARVRVYVPYGDDWYGYFMRRLAERPANVMIFARSLVGR